MRNQLLISTIAAALLISTTARAQSLADVAAAEAKRRKTQTRPTKVYTNDDLGGTLQTPAGSPVTAAAEPSTGAASATAANGGKPADAATPPRDEASADSNRAQAVDEKKTEAYWKSRASAIQQSLARQKVLMEAMQSRINALNAEALSVDDPGRHAMLQTNLTTAVGEMERLKQETEKLNKDWTATQEEARRANIPPGWLR
jgi:hypothetical protein